MSDQDKALVTAQRRSDREARLEDAVEALRGLVDALATHIGDRGEPEKVQPIIARADRIAGGVDERGHLCRVCRGRGQSEGDGHGWDGTSMHTPGCAVCGGPGGIGR